MFTAILQEDIPPKGIALATVYIKDKVYEDVVVSNPFNSQINKNKKVIIEYINGEFYVTSSEVNSHDLCS